MRSKVGEELKDKPHVILFLLILILSIGFRLVYLDQPMNYDEAYTFNNFASKPFLHAVLDYHAPNNHIFHTVFVHASYLLFGGDEIFIRLPALAFGLLSVLAIYLLARKLFDKNIALLSMILLSVSHFFIGYSAEARGYTLAVFLVIMTVYFLLEALRTEKLKFWLVSAVFASLAVYTVLSVFYFVFGAFAWVVFVKINNLGRDKKLKRPLLFLLLSGLITIILYVPALIFTGFATLFFLRHFYMAPVTFQELLSGLPFRLIEIIENFSLGIMHYVFLFIFVMLGYYFLYTEKKYNRLILFLSLPIITILFITVQSTLPPARVFIFLLPFFYMLVAKGITGLLYFLVSLRKVLSRFQLNKILPVLVILAFAAQGVTANLLTEKSFPQDSIEAAEWLKTELEPGDYLAIFCCEDQQIGYYMGQEVYDRYAIPGDNVSRIVMVINPSSSETPVDELADHEFEIRGAGEFELIKNIGRLNIYHSTKLENFIYIR